MADFSILQGKAVGGDQGNGVLVEDILFNIGTNKDKEDVATAEIIGTAKTVLRDKYNPSLGFDELPHPVPVVERVKFAMGTGKNDDNKILIDRLNSLCQIDPPLEDTPDLWERFTKDGKDSVYDKIVGKEFYFSTRLQTGKSGEEAGHYFFNLLEVTKRAEATMESVAEKMRRIMAKKTAKSVFIADE